MPSLMTKLASTPAMTRLATLPSSSGWMDPQWWLDKYGSAFIWVACAIVFVECGLFFPFLPGDSLLFSAGLFIKRGDVHMNIVVACALLSFFAFLGNVVGYEIGRAIGQPLYQRDGRILKRKHFDRTIEFFDKYGNKALVIGRFVPVVRTFITVVAGVGRMNRARFFTWSAVGAVMWATIVTLAGYALGNVSVIANNLEAAILAIVFISLLPMVFEWWMHKRRSAKEAAAADGTEVRGGSHRG